MLFFFQIFCDKGAERKARDEERRAAKRRMTTTGKRRLDEMYHTATERSEFYSMANRDKPPVSSQKIPDSYNQLKLIVAAVHSNGWSGKSCLRIRDGITEVGSYSHKGCQICLTFWSDFSFYSSSSRTTPPDSMMKVNGSATTESESGIPLVSLRAGTLTVP